MVQSGYDRGSVQVERGEYVNLTAMGMAAAAEESLINVKAYDLQFTI
jgi:hypothetical protein